MPGMVPFPSSSLVTFTNDGSCCMLSLYGEGHTLSHLCFCGDQQTSIRISSEHAAKCPQTPSGRFIFSPREGLEPSSSSSPYTDTKLRSRVKNIHDWVPVILGPGITALWNPKQDHEFESSLSYIASSRPGWDAETLSPMGGGAGKELKIQLFAGATNL